MPLKKERKSPMVVTGTPPRIVHQPESVSAPDTPTPIPGSPKDEPESMETNTDDNREKTN